MNVRQWLKGIHARLPGSLRRGSTQVYRFVFSRWYGRKIRLLQNKHEALQKEHAADGRFCLREGVTFHLAPESALALECFCHVIPVMIEEMDCFLKSAKGLNTFVDVGAFHGAFSLAFAALNPGTRVLALEPFPNAHLALKKNCELNPEFGITPLMQAAGREAGEIRMRQEWEHFVAAEPGENGDGDYCQVPVVPLDALAHEQQLWPEVIKIDVEGFEADVLAGAEECLKRCQVLHLEVHPEELEKRNVKTAPFLQGLAARGFDVLYTNGKPVKMAALPGETFRVVFLRHANG